MRSGLTRVRASVDVAARVAGFLLLLSALLYGLLVLAFQGSTHLAFLILLVLLVVAIGREEGGGGGDLALAAAGPVAWVLLVGFQWLA